MRPPTQRPKAWAWLPSSLLTGPKSTSTGGRSTAYFLLGYRWNKQNPQIKWYLRDDANLKGEDLISMPFRSSIAAASNTWDDATNQNLFADTNLVTISPTVKADTYDGNNAVAWNYFSPLALWLMPEHGIRRVKWADTILHWSLTSTSTRPIAGQQ